MCARARIISIPFARESVSKDPLHRTLVRARPVSIPFARESVSKDYRNITIEPRGYAFRFPSPGKVSPKIPHLTCKVKSFDIVSIPFHRESVSKENCRSSHPVKIRVSIPFHRESVSKAVTYDQIVQWGIDKFRFPSSGKVSPKQNLVSTMKG